MCRVGWVVLAPDAGKARDVWLGAEQVRLAEHWLSLLLRAVSRLGWGICA